MRKPVLAYISILTIVSAALLAWSGNHVSRSDWPFFVFLAPLIVLAGLYYVNTQSKPVISFSFEAAMKVLALFVAGLPTALWTSAIGTLALGLVKGLAVEKVAYNVSQSVISLFVAGMAFMALGGHSGPGFNQPFAALGAAVVYLFLNAAFLSQLFALLGGSSWWQLFRRQVLPAQTFVTFMVGQIAGIIGAYFVNHDSGVWLFMIVALLLLFQFSFRQYLRLLDSATLRGQELEATLNSTRSAILVTDPRGRIRHVNPPFLTLMEQEGTPVDFVGRPLSQLAATALAEPLLQATAAAGGGRVSGAVVRTEGPWAWVDYYRGPVRGTPDGAEGVIHVFTDISALKEAEHQLRRLHESVLVALTSLIDARDPYTHGHSDRVAEYARILARRMGLPPADCQRTFYSGLLHDIGKVGVTDSILSKVGPLTPDERARMMEHPVIGAQLLQKAGVFADLLTGVRSHHEWYNGGGYPDGLRGDAIPLDARIIGVADAFDAMTSDRPYRLARSVESAVDQLRTSQGIQFDPAVVSAFLGALEAGEIQSVRSLAVAGPPATGAPAPGRPADTARTAGVIRPVHKRELSILYELSRESYARLNLHAALRRFLEILHERVGPNAYSVYLQDATTGDLVLEAALGRELAASQERFRRGRGLVGKVAESGRIVIQAGSDGADASGAAGHPPAPAGDAVSRRTACAAPLRFGNEVVGVLLVDTGRPAGFGPDELYLLEALAPQLAAAIETARYHQQLAHAATHDGLTGLYNHSYFYDRLDDELARARRQSRMLSLVIIDLDDLKRVNAGHGHVAGDEALRLWARILAEHLRESDIVARYGGDEFAVIMPDTDRVQAAAVMERVVYSARSGHVSGNGGAPVPLPSASLGIATFPAEGDRAVDLVARADQQMYSGKGRVRMFGP